MHIEWKQDLKEKELLFVVSCAMSDSRQHNTKTCNQAEAFFDSNEKVFAALSEFDRYDL